MEKTLGDVWQLETPTQQQYCNLMNQLFYQALAGQVSAKNLIKKCYGDNWQTIKERMTAEVSVWYVWFMDGVNNLMRTY